MTPGVEATHADPGRGGGRLALAWRLALFLVIALAVTLLVGLVLPGTLLGGSVALLAGSLAAGWILLRHDGRGPGALGFHLSRYVPAEAALGTLLGTGVALAVVAAMAASGVLVWSVEQGSVVGWLRRGAAALAFLALPAAAEEAFARGYPLQALSEAWGPAWALAVTSVAFGALHLGNPQVTLLAALNVAAAGVFLGVVYLRTRSLWWATGAHVGWNWAHGFVADVPVSGLEVLDAPLYEGHGRGPDWLGGGGFGPEGSVLATVVVLAATVVCWRTPLLRPSRGALAQRPLTAGVHGSLT